MPELALQQLEAELASELVNEYTETLVNDPMYPPPLGRGMYTEYLIPYVVNPWSAEFFYKNLGDQRVYFNLISS